MDDLLYKNAIFYKENILPFTFLLETMKGVMIITNDEHNFAHLIGRQHSSNSNFLHLKSEDFFQKVLNKEITYENLLDIKNNEARKIQWIRNKNEIFIDLFKSFLSAVNLKIYKADYREVYTQINMDYFHFKTESNVALLGIMGDINFNTFSFNTIVSDDISSDNDLYERFHNFRGMVVKKTHKVFKKDVSVTLAKIDKTVLSSPRNNNKVKQKNKKKSDILSNSDFKEINKLIGPTLNISKGMNGKKSIKIIKDGKIIENGVRLKFNDFNSNIEIAEYINKKYK